MVTVDLHELNLKPNDVVLDAGCGLGRHLRHLARMPELKIFGIDKNAGALRETSKSMETMPDALSKDYLVSIADINKLPFADASFDCVICSEVLEHIPDHEKGA
jgi:ubiquinone/menaquinone biosynthesis C-methylase UbiE